MEFSLSLFLAELGACEEAIEWSREYDYYPERAWRECPRGDWMAWIVGKLLGGKPGSDQRKRLALCVCKCARLARPIKREDLEHARLNCLDVTERWARGEGPTIQDVRETRRAAYAAHDSYACYVAYTVAPAGAAQRSVLNAAASYYNSRVNALSRAAEIVREHYPWESIRHCLPQGAIA